jgi:hypothetical protein
MENNQLYEYTTSNLILMVGGQILALLLIILITLFGVEPLSFPANQVKNYFKGKSNSSPAPSPSSSSSTPSVLSNKNTK